MIPTIVTQALAGRASNSGSTDTVRDFTFVEDTAAGFVAAAAATGVDGEVVNLGTGTAVTVGEIVAQVGTPLETVGAHSGSRPHSSSRE